MPNMIGALDGKHIAIVKPRQSGSLYYNYKGFFSTVLLAACDADCRFTLVDVGAYGSQSDGGILRNSHFGLRLFEGDLPIPAATTLPATPGDDPETRPMNYFFAGDAAFPLGKNIMRPFVSQSEPHEEHFNYRLSRGRIQIERAFGKNTIAHCCHYLLIRCCFLGLLTGAWRVLRKPIGFEPETAKIIIMACVVLHNYLRYLSPVTPQENVADEEVHPLHGLEPRVANEGATSERQVDNRLLLSHYLYRNRRVHLNRNA